MGCIMTPMPNYLSTCLSLPFHHIRVVMMKGNEQCGSHTRDSEEKGSVEMVRLRWHGLRLKRDI